MSGGRFSTLLLAVLALSAPSAALAQDPGVHVDPGSPAGKEYAIPLEQARSQAARGDSSSGVATEGGSSGTATEGDGSAAQQEQSGTGKKRGSSGKAPLFGEGVTPVSDTEGGSKAAALAVRAAGGSGSGDSGVLSSPWVLGIGAILLGLGAAVLFRRMRTSGRS